MADVDPAVSEANRRASEEAARFREALPALLTRAALRGRWVVFKDGEVQADFDDEDEALRDALDRYGGLGGFVVARVETPRPIRLHGGLVGSSRRGSAE